MASLLLLLLLNSKKCNETWYKITRDWWWSVLADSGNTRTSSLASPQYHRSTIHRRDHQNASYTRKAKKCWCEKKPLRMRGWRKIPQISFFSFSAWSQSIFMMIQNFNSLSIPLFLLAISLLDKKLPSYGRSRSFRWEIFFF